MDFPGRYWHKLDDGRVQCDVCPRYCRLHDGQRGLCFADPLGALAPHLLISPFVKGDQGGFGPRRIKQAITQKV